MLSVEMNELPNCRSSGKRMVVIVVGVLEDGFIALSLILFKLLP
jgi:hypothetical protein